MYNDELPDNFVEYLFYISGILRKARLISSLGVGLTFLVLCKLVRIGISKKG